MSKSKMHKYEVGKSRPTENRASNSITNQQATTWVDKVREAGKYVDGDGVNSAINRVADILTDLILETKRGNCPREIISEVMKRCNVTASLLVAQANIQRGVRHVTGAGTP